MNKKFQYHYVKHRDLVLSRRSIFDLHEIDNERWSAAENAYFAAPRKPRLFATAEFEEDRPIEDAIVWYVVESGSRAYTVRRFLGWFYCSCPAFYTHKYCKHIVPILPETCVKCRKTEVKRGETCEKCDVTNAIYLKETTNAPPEKIGDIRI